MAMLHVSSHCLDFLLFLLIFMSLSVPLSFPAVLLSCSPSHNSTFVFPSSFISSAIHFHFRPYFFLLLSFIPYYFYHIFIISATYSSSFAGTWRPILPLPAVFSTESRGAKRWEREAECSLSASAHMKNAHHVPSWPSVYLSCNV